MLGASWQHSQAEIEHQGLEMFAGERCQPSVGLDGDLDKGNWAHEPHGIGVFEEALYLGCKRKIRDSARHIERSCVE